MSAPLRAFIIDDEPVLLHVLSMLLKELRYEVFSFDSAEAFLQSAPLDAPHLMLVDKNLPGISGLELLRRHREQGYDFEAILITADPDTESAIEAVRLGLYSYQQKPYELKSLMADVSGAATRLHKRMRGHAKRATAPIRRIEAETPLATEQGQRRLATSPLLSHIVDACHQRLSGEIRVLVQGEHVGSVVISAGMIAWGISKSQTENLGALLWRLGHITREQLARVRGLYDKYEGKKRLAAILEEEGYLSSEVLRRCLKLHIQFAMANLFAHQDATVQYVAGEELQGERNLFVPDEVLPLQATAAFVNRVEAAPDESWQDLWSGNLVLRPFLVLPGYLASVVASRDGTVLTAHFNVAVQRPTILGVFLASMLDSAANLSGAMELGGVDGIALSCGQGHLVTRAVTDDGQYFAAVLTDQTGDPELTNTSLDTYARMVSEWLADTFPEIAPPQELPDDPESEPDDF